MINPKELAAKIDFLDKMKLLYPDVNKTIKRIFFNDYACPDTGRLIKFFDIEYKEEFLLKIT